MDRSCCLHPPATAFSPSTVSSPLDGIISLVFGAFNKSRWDQWLLDVLKRDSSETESRSNELGRAQIDGGKPGYCSLLGSHQRISHHEEVLDHIYEEHNV